jgi:hypothetical protein
VVTTTLSKPTGDPDYRHLEDEYSKYLKVRTSNTYPPENPHTGQLTGINYRIWWTFASPRVSPATSPMQSPASNFPRIILRSSSHFRFSTQAILLVPQPRLCNRKTDWDAFRYLLNERLLLNVPLKPDFDIEVAIKNFDDIIQWAGWTITPEHTEARQIYDCPILIKQKLLNERRLRRNWRFSTPESKRLLNAATRELKQLLIDTNNASFQTILQDLSPTASTDFSLWKAAKEVKQATNSSHPLRTTQGTWAGTNTEKAQTFADT